jgi:hypothetical protein
MSRSSLLALPLLVLLAALPCPAPACSLCGVNLQQLPTFRQEAAQPHARAILIGTAQNPTVKPDGTGETELQLKHVLRNDPVLGDRKVVVLPRYLPVTDKKDPPRWLVFCDVFKGQLDPYRGVPLHSDDGIEYVKKALTLDAKDTVANLAFFFKYLEHPDKEVAADAFLEFAKATDQDIGRAASKLSPDKLRTWLGDKKTPPERLNIYALLLGACGGDGDATFLQSLLKEPGERYSAAYDGILAGYMHLRPREGWELALTTLGDARKNLQLRLAVVRTLRFYHGYQPKESRPQVMKGMEIMLAQPDLADLAVEDLRRWQVWDLTRDVLALYGKKGYDAPLMQRTLLRYALCSKDPAVVEFMRQRRKEEPDLVKEVEESLEFEKPK